jgi:Xaa-Pro dipeptidase
MTDIASFVTQGQDAVFPPEELDARLDAARHELSERGIDVYLVTGPENIFYLTGQQTPGYYTFQALLLPAEGEPWFIVRELEHANLVANSWLENIEHYRDNADPVDVVSTLLEKLGWSNKRIAIDKRGWFLPIALYEALASALGAVADAAGVVEKLRRVKSPLEIEKIARAAHYTDIGLQAGMAAVREGASDNDLVAAMMYASVAAGGEYVGMEPLCSVGNRTGVPHGTWRRGKLGANAPAFLEMSSCHDRYHASLMRCAWVGQPPDEARRMMDVCLEGLDAALAKLKPGNTCADVHNACQSVIDKAGYTDAFKKRVGYSVGISFAPDWGEGHILSLFTGVDVVLETGMSFHIVPALRRYGEFTVCVSETVTVTDDGHRVIGTFPRDMHVV